MSTLEKIVLSEDEREKMTADPLRQDEAHLKGAYAYLSDTALTARYSVISGIVEQYNCDSLLDIGCYVGGLRGVINRDRGYHGIDISPSAIKDAEAKYDGFARTRFSVADIRDINLEGRTFPCVVWAGIGFGYSDKDSQSFSDLFEKACGFCEQNGLLIFECIESYAWIQSLIENSSQMLNLLNVTYPYAPVHNKRTVFVARKN